MKMCVVCLFFLIIFHPKDWRLLSRSFSIQQEPRGEMERERERMGGERAGEKEEKREKETERENPLPALPSQ